MIRKVGIIALVWLWVEAVLGSPYSRVYVHSGSSDVVPVEYINYGSPTVLSGPQIAQLSAAPVGSVLPLSSVSSLVSPCVSPCTYPGQSVATVAAVQPSANIVAYNSLPNVPVVVAAKEGIPNYEYSYVVYDENTGDQKGQRELSDGSVVRGEYSFLQPDGYVREVQYTADDVKGFNAVVKNIRPDSVPVSHKKKVEVKEHHEAPPCAEVKNEETHEAIKEEYVPPHEEHEPAHEEHEPAHEEHEPAHEEHEPAHEEAHEPAHEEAHEEAHEPAHEEAHEEAHEPAHEEVHEAAHEETHEAVHEEPHEHHEEEPEHHEEAHEPHEEEHHEEVHEEHEAHEEHHEEPPAEAHEEHEPEPAHEEAHEQEHEAAHEEAHEEPHEAHEATHEAVQEVEAPEADNGVVVYNDLIKCVQAAINKSNKGPTISPLTYIILNGPSKPC